MAMEPKYWVESVGDVLHADDVRPGADALDHFIDVHIAQLDAEQCLTTHSSSRVCTR